MEHDTPPTPTPPKRTKPPKNTRPPCVHRPPTARNQDNEGRQPVHVHHHSRHPGPPTPRAAPPQPPPPADRHHTAPTPPTPPCDQKAMGSRPAPTQNLYSPSPTRIVPFGDRAVSLAVSPSPPGGQGPKSCVRTRSAIPKNNFSPKSALDSFALAGVSFAPSVGRSVHEGMSRSRRRGSIPRFGRCQVSEAVGV